MTFFEPDPWQSPRPPRAHRPSRSGRSGGALTVVAAGLGTAAAIVGMLFLTTPGGENPLAAIFDSAPSAEVVALADQMHLTDEGRAIFYDTRPELLSGTEFADRCQTGSEAQTVGDFHTVGCYAGTDRIVILESSDPSLHAETVTTAAHELLHAAYFRLGSDERRDLDVRLEAAVATIPAGNLVHAQIASSVGDDPSALGTERFAYLGTQITTLSPELETVLARFIADRPALVAVNSAQG